MASVDLKKAFDRVECESLFDALSRQSVPQPYINILRVIYAGQIGSAESHGAFAIERRVKQGDIY